MAKSLPWNYRPPQPPSRAEEVPRHRSKKDTKKWCRGKVGRPHTPKWELWKGVYSKELPAMTFVCQSCRKELDWWSNMSGKKQESPVLGSTEPFKRKPA